MHLYYNPCQVLLRPSAALGEGRVVLGTALPGEPGDLAGFSLQVGLDMR